MKIFWEACRSSGSGLVSGDWERGAGGPSGMGTLDEDWSLERLC